MLSLYLHSLSQNTPIDIQHQGNYFRQMFLR